MKESLKAVTTLLLAIAINHVVFGITIATPVIVFFLWVVIMLIFVGLRALTSRVTVHYSRLNFKWLMSRKNLAGK